MLLKSTHVITRIEMIKNTNRLQKKKKVVIIYAVNTRAQEIVYMCGKHVIKGVDHF